MNSLYEFNPTNFRVEFIKNLDQFKNTLVLRGPAGLWVSEGRVPFGGVGANLC